MYKEGDDRGKCTLVLGQWIHELHSDYKAISARMELLLDYVLFDYQLVKSLDVLSKVQSLSSY